MTLTDFLVARIGEDYAAADLVLRPYGDRAATNDAAWWPNPHEWDKCLSSDETPLVTRYTPQRVLAECEAKRRIIELHRDAGRSQGDTDTGYGEIDHCCGQCGTLGEYGTPWPCRTVRALALPYADHPDYQEEWRP